MQCSNLIDDIAEPSAIEIFDSSYRIVIPGLKFPINKRGLIKLLEQFQNEFHKKYKKIPLRLKHDLFLIMNLPDSNKVYKNDTSLTEDLTILVNNKEIAEELLGAPERMTDCILFYQLRDERQKDRFMESMIKWDSQNRQAYQERKQQYEKKMKLAS